MSTITIHFTNGEKIEIKNVKTVVYKKQFLTLKTENISYYLIFNNINYMEEIEGE